jgi:NADPH2:quinone reductase
MHAVRIHETGGPEAMVVEEVPEPTPGPGQLLVRLAAAGVNFVDIYYRMGLYPTNLPTTPGSEAAGEVVAIGEGVEGVVVGQRVCSAEFAGAYAQYAIVAAERAVPVPDGVGEDVAAAALLQGMTAHYLLHDSYPAKAGDTVLVHAAAGGMGLLLCQMASRIGVRVIGTASTPEKAELARGAGAAEVLDYDDVAAKVRVLTGGVGVAAVYDGVGRSMAEANLASLRLHGVWVQFGNASGAVPPIDPLRLMSAGSLYVTRPTLRHFVTTREALLRRAGDVLGSIADGALSIRIGGRYPLSDAPRAHEDLQARRTTGKLLLVP